jgi:hypothetical protein
MRVALATTTNDEPIASSSRGPSKSRGAVRPANENETQLDLTAQIPKAPAERPAEQSESQRFAMLQHATPTELGQTPAEYGPSDDPVFKNSDDELEHLHYIAERIQNSAKLKSGIA